MSAEVTISQSLVKDYRKVMRGDLCPSIFRARWIDFTWKDEPSEAMRAGQWFEYCATGQKNYHGEIPEPDLVYKGKPGEKLSATFERAYFQAENFKRYCTEIGITDIESGRKVIVGDLRATVDIECNLKGIPSVIDLKYSGMIGNKWEEMGWYEEFNPMTRRAEIKFTPEQAEYHGIQAHFNQKLTGKPFFFWIFSSGTVQDSRLVEVNLTDETKARFDEEIETVREWLQKEIARGKRGFFPRPKFAECLSCDINQCPVRASYPFIETTQI